MKTRMGRFLLAVVLSSSFGPFSVYAQDVGEPELSDQDPVVSEFARVAERLLSRFRAHPDALPRGFVLERFQDFVANTPVFARPCRRQRCALGTRGPENEAIYVSKVSCPSVSRGVIELCVEGWTAAGDTQEEIVLSTYLTLATSSLDFRGVLSRQILAELTRREGLANQPDEPTFPLVGQGGGVEREFEHGLEEYGAHSVRQSSQTIGAGGGGQNLDGRVRGAGLARVRLDGGFYHRNFTHYPVYPVGISGDLQGTVSLSDEKPVVQVRMNMAGGYFAHLWVAVEANRWRTISENIGRLMLGTQLMIEREGDKYILVKLGALGLNLRSESIQAVVSDEHLEDADFFERGIGTGISQALSVLVRNGSFFIEVQGDVDYIARPSESPNDGERPDPQFSIRSSLEVGIGYALGFLFPNDEVRLQGRVVHYGRDLNVTHNSVRDVRYDFPSVTVGTFGAYYQVRFGN